jgi:hypothetical protein
MIYAHSVPLRQIAANALGCCLLAATAWVMVRTQLCLAWNITK